MAFLVPGPRASSLIRAGAVRWPRRDRPHRERSPPQRSGAQKVPGRAAQSGTLPRVAHRGSEIRPLSAAGSAFPLLQPVQPGIRGPRRTVLTRRSTEQVVNACAQGWRDLFPASLLSDGSWDRSGRRRSFLFHRLGHHPCRQRATRSPPGDSEKSMPLPRGTEIESTSLQR
jgi:hypothetical protein